MKIAAVTPSAAAANPSHPDHARWVKEQTLKREIEQAKLLGLSTRDAETINVRNLDRLDLRRQTRKPRKAAPRPEQREVTRSDLVKAGVTKKVATARALPPMPACKLCRRCVRCKRELRLSQIATKAREGDQQAIALIREIVAIGFAAKRRVDYKDAIGRELPFSRLRGFDRDRAITAGAEWVCDRSVSFMGQWR